MYLCVQSGSTSLSQALRKPSWASFAWFLYVTEPICPDAKVVVSFLTLLLFAKDIECWIDRLNPQIYEYGKAINGIPQLRKTFALNALAGLDNAAWLLYAQERCSSLISCDFPQRCSRRAFWPALSS